MSGTSLDGLDVALCALSGSGAQTQVELLQFDTVPYDSWIKAEIRKVFAKREIDFQQLCLLNPHIGILHGEMVNACLQKWGIAAAEVDLVAAAAKRYSTRPKPSMARPITAMPLCKSAMAIMWRSPLASSP